MAIPLVLISCRDGRDWWHGGEPDRRSPSARRLRLAARDRGRRGQRRPGDHRRTPVRQSGRQRFRRGRAAGQPAPCGGSRHHGVSGSRLLPGRARSRRRLRAGRCGRRRGGPSWRSRHRGGVRDIGRVRRSRAGGRGASGAPRGDGERTRRAVGGTQLHGNPRRCRRRAVQRHLQSNTARRRRRIPAEPVGCGRAGRARSGGRTGPRHRSLRVDRKRRRRVDQRPPALLGRRVRGGRDLAVPRVDPGPGIVRAGRAPHRPARADRRGQGGTHGGRPPRGGVAHGSPVGRRRRSGRLAAPSGRRPGRVDRGDARRGDDVELHTAVQRAPGRDRHQRRWTGDPRGRCLRSQRARGPRAGRTDRGAAAVTAPARGQRVQPRRHDRQCHRLRSTGRSRASSEPSQTWMPSWCCSTRRCSPGRWTLPRS